MWGISEKHCEIEWLSDRKADEIQYRGTLKKKTSCELAYMIAANWNKVLALQWS